MPSNLIAAFRTRFLTTFRFWTHSFEFFEKIIFSLETLAATSARRLVAGVSIIYANIIAFRNQVSLLLLTLLLLLCLPYVYESSCWLLLKQRYKSHRRKVLFSGPSRRRQWFWNVRGEATAGSWEFHTNDTASDVEYENTWPCVFFFF